MDSDTTIAAERREPYHGVVRGPEQPPGPHLSGARTFVLWGLAIVWFSEMVLWGLRSLSEGWGARVWDVAVPADPQLATALHIARTLHAPDKAALGVLAVFAIRSKDPFVRTALYVSMSLVPPLNVAFLFRAQGFPLQPTAIGTVLSIILWGSFILFREHADHTPSTGASSGQVPIARWEIVRYGWFALNATILTVIALGFLFAPRGALNVMLPCSGSLLRAHEGQLEGLTYSATAVGTHVFALATATWIATVHGRRNRILPQAVTVAMTVHAALMCALPLTQIIRNVGAPCATSSTVFLSVPLLVGWLTYAAIDTTRVRRLAASGTR